jgi:outer membrane biosynthesis protein TonB
MPPARREFRRMVVWSALLHAGALGLVMVSPKISEREPPRVISVELVAPAPPAARAAPKPAPAPPPAAVPAPPPPPPPPEPKEIVLPEKPTAPKPQEKPKPKPREEVFKEPPKKKDENLDDLLAQLRGSEKAPPAPAAAPVETAVAPSPGPSEGVGELTPEEAAWRARVRQKMRGIWIVPPGFRTQPLKTLVVVTLDGAGNIVGSPRITKKSGNPWYDDGVMLGLAKAKSLPAPPQAGDWVLQFEPGDSL